MFDEEEIRHHFPDDEVDLALDPSEQVLLEKQLPGGIEFAQCGVVPDDIRDMKSIRAFVRRVALAGGAEAWRAMTERGEILCAYCVSDLADELGGGPFLTRHDQLCLAAARSIMGGSVR
jgi:hypothetical protein